MLTEQEKQIAWDAWLTMAREHLSVFGNDPHGDGAKCLYAIVEAVLAQRTDGVRNDLIREAQIDAQIDRQRQRASISVPQSGVVKTRSTKEGAEFWDHVESIAAQAKPVPQSAGRPIDEETYKQIYAAAIEGYTGGGPVQGGISAFDECEVILRPLIEAEASRRTRRRNSDRDESYDESCIGDYCRRQGR